MRFRHQADDLTGAVSDDDAAVFDRHIAIGQDRHIASGHQVATPSSH